MLVSPNRLKKSGVSDDANEGSGTKKSLFEQRRLSIEERESQEFGEQESETQLNTDSGSKNNKPPQIPSLKSKLHQASLQRHGIASESAGASTAAAHNLSNSNTKMSMAPMTAGGPEVKGSNIFSGGGDLQMTGQRGSLTYLS